MKGNWVKKLLTKVKKKLFQAKSPSLKGKFRCLVGRLPVLLGEGEGPCDILLPEVEQKIPDSPIKTTFLREVKTAVRLGIKSRFGDLA